MSGGKPRIRISGLATLALLGLGISFTATAAANEDGLVLNDLRPDPILPYFNKEIEVTGFLRCVDYDLRPGTRTIVHLTATKMQDWSVVVPEPEREFYLDSSRCADPSYTVPFTSRVFAQTTNEIAPGSPFVSEIVARVAKEQTGEVLSFTGHSMANLTLVAAESIVFDASQGRDFGFARVPAGGHAEFSFPIENLGNSPLSVTGRIVAADPLRNASAHFSPLSPHELGAPWEAYRGGPDLRTYYTFGFRAPTGIQASEVFDFTVILEARSIETDQPAPQTFAFPAYIEVYPTDTTPGIPAIVAAIAFGCVVALRGRRPI